MDPNHPRDGLSKIEIIVIIGIVLLVIALFLPNLEQSRGQAREVQCKNYLRQISLALHRYHDTYGSFPPAVTTGPDSTPWHSWRTLLLPHLQDDLLWDQYNLDEPWNSESNLALVANNPMPPVLGCPSDASAQSKKMTSYVAIIGEGTMWPPEGTLNLNDVPDGDSHTIHVVERTDSGLLWTEPGDLEFDDLDFTVKGLTVGTKTDAESAERSTSHHHVAFVDGGVQQLALETEPAVLKSMLLRNDGPPPETE